MTERTQHVATDIGGTFTDLAAWDHVTQQLTVQKTPTSEDFAQGVLDAISTSSVDMSAVRQFRHGSTIAINAVLEETGASTALLATSGFGDVLELGRGNRPRPFALGASGHRVLVEPGRRLEVEERTLADGTIHRPLDGSALDIVVEQLRHMSVQAIAVCLLHSYANGSHEAVISEVIKSAFPDAFVVTSHDVCQEAKEFERMSTTVVHAYVGPTVDSYLRILSEGLETLGSPDEILLMQSNGGLLPREVATRRPAALMESGPASGVMGAIEFSRKIGVENCVAFDMGGTTAKASLVERYRPAFLDVYYIGGYESGLPLMSPVIDIHEVGAGGGSIAWLDDAGAIHVGPRSAGSIPGPICYGRGGREPTVCDADLVLGRLHAGDNLGGSISMDLEAARCGINDAIAGRLGLDLERCAEGILKIANGLMAQAVRKVSIERGRDPREFALVAYGGAGPMHAVDVARELDIARVVVPPAAGVFSSLGMLFSPLRSDRSRTVSAPLSEEGLDSLRSHADALIEELSTELPEQQKSRQGAWLSIRYRGQEHDRRVDVVKWDEGLIKKDFEDAYQRRYGYVLDGSQVEVTTVGAWREVSQPTPSWSSMTENVPPPAWIGQDEHQIWCSGHGWRTAEILWRPSLAPDRSITGPALIIEPTSTTMLGPDDVGLIGEIGEISVQVGSG